MAGAARLAGFGHAVPPGYGQQELWDGFFREHFGGDRRAERIWRAAGVRIRHGAAMPPGEDVSRWGTGARMSRYADAALPLGKAAVTDALDAARVPADQIGLFVVASCTGYTTPGLDILLARDLGLPMGAQRLFVGHMGCYAALPALGAAADFAAAHGRPAVVLCAELPSLHLQPRATGRPDLSQVTAHALFADAAAAAVLTPGGPGLELAGLATATDTSAASYMTWEVTETGFRMGLSPRVPSVLARHVHRVTTGLLAEHGLDVRDVAGWAVHPGGPRILDVVADRLALAPDALAASRGVLADFGNCSSATILLLLERLRPSLAPGGRVIAVGFGPGLTLYAALLRVTS
jgi:predicted naringenin-chalcone synthase